MRTSRGININKDVRRCDSDTDKKCDTTVGKHMPSVTACYILLLQVGKERRGTSGYHIMGRCEPQITFSNHSWDHQPNSLTLMEIPSKYPIALLEFPAAQTQVLSLGPVMSRTVLQEVQVLREFDNWLVDIPIDGA